MTSNKYKSNANKRDLIVYIKMTIPLLVLLVLTIAFKDFVIHAVRAGFVINMSIISAAFYGVVLIYMRLRSAQKDFRIIERFGREAIAGANMRELLNEPWLRTVYVRHYLAHIANTGGTLNSQLNQNAIESELHALQEEYNNKLELPQFISGFMIAMGLLGTFIGLLETLTGISGMLDGMGAPGTNVEEQFSQLVVKLREPLAGMGIAFSASMFGLITSLMLAIMMINLRRYINRVISLARNVMHDLIVIAASAPVTGQAQRSAASDSSAISNTTIAGRFDLLTRKIEAVLDAFESSIGTTQRMVDLMGFGPRMKELSERTLDELKLINTKITDQHRLSQSLIEVQKDQVINATNLLEYSQTTKDTNIEILEAIRSLSNSEIFFSQRRDQEFREKILSEIKVLGSTQLDTKKLSQSLIDVVKANLKEAENAILMHRESKDEIAGLITRLGEALAKVEDVNIGGARHLYDIKERLNKFGNTFGVVDIIASGVSGQTALLETLIEETRSLKGPAGDSNLGQTDEHQLSDQDFYGLDDLDDNY